MRETSARGRRQAEDPRVRAPRDPARVACLEPSAQRRRGLGAVGRAAGVDLSTFPSFQNLVSAIDLTLPSLVVVAFDALPDRTALPLIASGYGLPTVAIAASVQDAKAALAGGAYVTLVEPLDRDVFALTIRSLVAPPPVAAFVLARQAQTFAGLTVSIVNHTVEHDGVRHPLTPTEWQLLAFLLAYPNRVHSRRALAVGAWGLGYDGRVEQVELMIFRLRRKVERDPAHPRLITTVPGAGYSLAVSDSSPVAHAATRDPARAGAVNAIQERRRRLFEDIVARSDKTVTSLREFGGARRDPGLEADAVLVATHADHFRRRLARWPE